MTEESAPKVNRGKIVSEAAFRRMWMDLTMSREEIGALIGITPQCVMKRAQRRGLPSRKVLAHDTCRVFDVDEFRDMWVTGVRTKDILAHFGCSNPTTTAAAKRFGLPPRGRRWHHRGISIEEYREIQLGRAMAAEAKRREDRLRRAEM